MVRIKNSRASPFCYWFENDLISLFLSIYFIELCENPEPGFIEGYFIQMDNTPSSQLCAKQVYECSSEATGMSWSTNDHHSCYAHYGLYMNYSDVTYFTCLFPGNRIRVFVLNSIII